LVGGKQQGVDIVEVEKTVVKAEKYYKIGYCARVSFFILPFGIINGIIVA